MDVIGFLYVLLGSNTIQLHDTLDSRRTCECSGLVSVVKVATVHVLPKSNVLFCFFLWAKGLNANYSYIHKEIFPVYGGKCLSRKAIHVWDEQHGKCYTDEEEVEMEVWKRPRQQSKYFCSAGFDAMVKQRDKCISASGGYAEK
jgi:hypothetical protein